MGGVRSDLAKKRARSARWGTHGGLGGDITVVAVGTALYVAMLLWGHPRLIGVSFLPGGRSVRGWT